MTARFIQVQAEGGAFRALLAGDPADTRRPAVVLLPEIYNINSWIREVAERYAQRGHAVLVPDLFWRQEPGVDLEYNPEDQQRGRVFSVGLQRDLAVADLLAAVWELRLRGARQVAAVGFCLGGELAYLAAAEDGLDAAVAYYPTRMENHVQHGPRIDVPLLVHIGERDHRTPPELVRALRDALSRQPSATVDVYLEADHGFGRFGHPPHHPASADQAEARTWALLDTLPARSPA